MERFDIISDGEKDPHHETAAEIKRYLEYQGKCARIIGSPSQVEDESLADIAIVLGGDGYVIQAAKRFAGTGVPILGVNFGTLGFLTEVEKPKLVQSVDAILEGRYEIDQRIALTARLAKPGVGAATGLAINEFVIAKQDFGHMITA